MAIFMDLDDEPEPPHQQQGHLGAYHGMKPEWTLWARDRDSTKTSKGPDDFMSSGASASDFENSQASSSMPSDRSSIQSVQSFHSTNKATEALGCYPIVMAIASSLDLNAIDNLSRTCRTVHDSLLYYRSAVLKCTLHCANEDTPISHEDTLRYRARAGNWFYMQEDVAESYNGKSGSCARDMVAECQRCATVICRNCAIKPPAPAVLKDRHRRLCIPCTKAPLGCLAKPPLRPDTPVDDDLMRAAVCSCSSRGVWLCQPCGRSIRGADHDYQAIWKWRNQYGEVLGGLGTGIGEGDRGVPCGRESACCGSIEREQETDCDAEDARLGSATMNALFGPSSASSNNSLSQTNNNNDNNTNTEFPWLLSTTTPSAPMQQHSDGDSHDSRTPSPQLRPGYSRHEVEGIGGVVKTVGVRVVRVGACVPEWEDEKHRGVILGREISGQARSWCGWCWRVIPGNKDLENTKSGASSSIAVVRPGGGQGSAAGRSMQLPLR